MFKRSGKCGDCIYAKPAHDSKPSGEQVCGWNSRHHNADHECEMHSFFPRKSSRQEERK